jgi:predicted RNA-binding Zn-ribbon protein involved in translation (DUF1610 family)
MNSEFRMVDVEGKIVSEYWAFYKCPNCDEMIEVRDMSLIREFECPYCAAVLRFPGKIAKLFILSFLPFVASAIFVMWTLVGAVPIEILLLQGDPVIGVVLWIGLVGSFGLTPILYGKLKLRVVRLPTYCGSCGSKFAIEGAHFCVRCGADLRVVSSKPVSRSRRLETPAKYVELPSEKCLGICMVCKQDVKGSDTSAWCPHCGRLAHKAHLLEYLHVHDECPACGNQLDENELTQQLPKENFSKETRRQKEVRRFSRKNSGRRPEGEENEMP